MPKRQCYSCHLSAHMTRVSDPSRVDGKEATWTAAFKCDECGCLSVGTMPIEFPGRLAERPGNQQVAKNRTVFIREQFDARDAPLEWDPYLIVWKEHEHVPDHIADAAAEAHACHSIRAYRASAALARAVVEATAKNKKITNGGIKAKIQGLESEQHIRPFVARQAEQIRELGNDMAHGDFVDPIDRTESEYVLALMDEVLQEVFEAPGSLEAFEHARAQKKQGGASPA